MAAHEPGIGNPRPGHVSPGNLLTGIAPGLVGWPAVLAGPTDAADWRVHARCAGHVLAAFARWPAIEMWRDWAWTPRKLGTEVTALFAGELKRILRPAARRLWRRWIAVGLW